MTQKLYKCMKSCQIDGISYIMSKFTSKWRIFGQNDGKTYIYSTRNQYI